MCAVCVYHARSVCSKLCHKILINFSKFPHKNKNSQRFQRVEYRLNVWCKLSSYFFLNLWRFLSVNKSFIYEFNFFQTRHLWNNINLKTCCRFTYFVQLNLPITITVDSSLGFKGALKLKISVWTTAVDELIWTLSWRKPNFTGLCCFIINYVLPILFQRHV